MSNKRKREAVNVLRHYSLDRSGRRVPMSSPEAYEGRSVAVPFGNCEEPANVKAGGKSCRFRFQCAGCPFYRPDPSFLVPVEEHIRSLMADRELGLMMEVDEFVTRNLDDQIKAFKEIVAVMKAMMEDMDVDEREELLEASALMRKQRAGAGVGSAALLPVPVLPPRRDAQAG